MKTSVLIFFYIFYFFFQCTFVTRLGFRRGSYKCECAPGYYYPDLTVNQKFYNGSLMEDQYELKLTNKTNNYEDLFCLPCGPGCDECIDGRSCLFAINWTLRTVLLFIQCLVMLGTVPLLIFTIQFSDVKVRAPSRVIFTRLVLPRSQQ